MERRDDWIGPSRSSTNSPLSIHPSSILAKAPPFPNRGRRTRGIEKLPKNRRCEPFGRKKRAAMRNPFLKCRDDFFGVRGQM